MTKILGLDLGVTSIGWALIEENEPSPEILGMGCRIIPYSYQDADDFTKGTGESINHDRTVKRTIRKGYDRYQLRRRALVDELSLHGMFPDASLFQLDALTLYGLRNKAANERISLQEMGRIWLHLNQKRGYKHGAKDSVEKKEDKDYVNNIQNRYAEIKGIETVGQHLYEKLLEDRYYRIKQNVFPREAYIEEFNKIWETQRQFYPNLLSDEYKNRIRNEIIYYQRPLKTQKGLVSVCEFEGFWAEDKKSNRPGRLIFTGPRVAPRSSPLAQICKIWESVNNIRIKRIHPETRHWENFSLDLEQKSKLVDYLNFHELLTESKMFELLGLSEAEGWMSDKSSGKRGIQGNLTMCMIRKIIGDKPELKHMMTFDLKIETIEVLDENTGEILERRQISTDFESQQFYRLWHLIYSSKNDEDRKVLVNKFGLSDETAEKLSGINFTKGGFSNKSAKAIRKILPYLMEGKVYSDACAMAGYNHSDSLTLEQNMNRQLKEKLDLLPRNNLRQPVVEKILNQMINVVNSIIDKYGKPDEIRVELARELKQNKAERNKTFHNLSIRDRQNKVIAQRLEEEYHVKATRRNIEKWRLYHEVGGRCLYCNKTIELSQMLQGVEADVEHIIPRAVFFDDSFVNKTISHVRCNSAKDRSTAFDFMNSKSKEEFEVYLERVEELHRSPEKIDDGVQCEVNHINSGKFNRLLMASEKIPDDFISRQMRETQYISRKAKEILEQVARNVHATSGSVTSKLREIWGWNDIIMNLRLPEFRAEGMTDWIELYTNGQVHKKEVITGWTKRDDNRHHAIDALAIACTKPAFIQRINKLNSETVRKEIHEEIKGKGYKDKLSLLDNYLISQKPFDTSGVGKEVARILISFKSGKKVASKGRRVLKKDGIKVVAQNGIIVPRGPLSEESVYGKIKSLNKNIPLKQLFLEPDRIVKSYIKKAINERLAQHGNDPVKAFKSCKENPLIIGNDRNELSFGSIYADEYVIKYPLSSLKLKDVDSIIDGRIKILVRDRFREEGTEGPLKGLETNPLFFDKEKKSVIRSVKCFTKLSDLEPINEGRGYVKPGNNHHIAIYKDQEGIYQEHIVTFWHAVDRIRFGLPVIIKYPAMIWEEILNSGVNPPEVFLSKLPNAGWSFVTSMQQNELFVIGIDSSDLDTYIAEGNYIEISKHLYRVQKLSKTYYQFRHHLDTKVDDKYNDKKNEPLSIKLKRLYRISSLNTFINIKPVKVRVNLLGQIILK